MQRVIVKDTTISSRNQTVVPAEVRRRLGLSEGDKLVWGIVVDENQEVQAVKVMPKKTNWGDYLSGLGKRLWRGVDTDSYVKKMREEWEQRD
jgi:AbrB family looped-hinge helix DNA binding protein